MIAIRGMVIDGFVEAWQQAFLGSRDVTSLFDLIATETIYTAQENKNINVLPLSKFSFILNSGILRRLMNEVGMIILTKSCL